MLDLTSASATASATAILLLAAGLAAGADPAPAPEQHWEVRIVGSVLPGFDSGIAGADDSRLSGGGELLAVYHGGLPARPLGFILGAGIFDDSRRSKVANPDNVASYEAQGIVLLAGVSGELTPRWSLEAHAEVRAGAGRLSAKETFANGDFEVLGDYGRYLAGSVLAGATYSCTSRIAIGLLAGFDGFSGHSDFVAHAVTVRGDGPVVQAHLGFIF